MNVRCRVSKGKLHRFFVTHDAKAPRTGWKALGWWRGAFMHVHYKTQRSRRSDERALLIRQLYWIRSAIIVGAHVGGSKWSSIAEAFDLSESRCRQIVSTYVPTPPRRVSLAIVETIDGAFPDAAAGEKYRRIRAMWSLPAEDADLWLCGSNDSTDSSNTNSFIGLPDSPQIAWARAMSESCKAATRFDSIHDREIESVKIEGRMFFVGHDGRAWGTHVDIAGKRLWLWHDSSRSDLVFLRNLQRREDASVEITTISGAIFTGRCTVSVVPRQRRRDSPRENSG
jgi:hypothetical protein